MCLCLRYWGVIGRANSKHSWKIMVFACLLGKWWHSLLSLMIWQAGIFKALVNRGVLLNDWIFWKKQLFFIYYLHQNTWIPRWIISGKMTWEKNQSPVRITFHPEQVSQCPIWKLGKKEHLIFRSPPSGCFWLKLIHTLKLSYSISKE